MSDVRKLLARLNPGAIQYGVVGGSGIPDLTPQDIAGALGFIRDDFQREVFCALWWPDGSRLTRGAFDLQLRNKQLAEWMRRQRALVAARLGWHLAREEADGTHGGVPGVRKALSHARAEAEEAKAKAWPAYSERYKLIRSAVLNELASPHNCKPCGGRGHVRAGALMTMCKACSGTGRAHSSERTRAEAIEVPRSMYARWADVYQWTLELCSHAERQAADKVERALGA